MTQLVLVKYKRKFKCLGCKKKPVVIVASYDHDTDDLNIDFFCKECFKKGTPEYTLEGDCLVCKKNFKCNIQKILFSKEEIKAYKKQFWG